MTRARTTGARRSWQWPILTAVAIVAGVVATMPAEAAKAKSDADKAGAATDVDRTIETAIASMESGKTDLAVQELTSAITGGKIAQSKLARALYLRGLAYRKQGKPAQAIADFTSALWIKNGLEARERDDALLNRAGAYRDAGLADQAEADEKRVAAAAAAKGQTAAARTAPAVSRTEASAAAPSSSGSGLGGFFSALFGGSPATQQAVGGGFATSVSPPPDSRSGTTGGQQTPRVSGWSTQTGPSAGAQAAASPSAAKPTPARQNTAGWAGSTVVRNVSGRQAAATPTMTGSTGKSTTTYVQVAAFRSRREAQAAATRLTQMGAAQPGKREVEIEEAVMGNMGALFRVRLGPFASASEVESVCPRLRDAGLDCLVIDR